MNNKSINERFNKLRLLLKDAQLQVNNLQEYAGDDEPHEDSPTLARLKDLDRRNRELEDLLEWIHGTATGKCVISSDPNSSYQKFKEHRVLEAVMSLRNRMDDNNKELQAANKELEGFRELLHIITAIALGSGTASPNYRFHEDNPTLKAVLALRVEYTKAGFKPNDEYIPEKPVVKIPRNQALIPKLTLFIGLREEECFDGTGGGHRGWWAVPREIVNACDYMREDIDYVRFTFQSGRTPMVVKVIEIVYYEALRNQVGDVCSAINDTAIHYIYSDSGD